MIGICYTLGEPGGVTSTDTGSNRTMPLEGNRMAKPHANLKDYIEQRSIPEPNSGCWLWLGALYQDGYGAATVKQRNLRAHRVSYAAFKGNIPDGMQVCHRCDNRACVNPDHLWLGTHMDNVGDCLSKKRQSRGSINGQSKLRESDIAAIRADTRSLSAIARDYGVADMQISRVKRRLTWRHA